MYYLCKFSDAWSLYDAQQHSSRSLGAPEIKTFKGLFPGLLQENRILEALQIISVHPNRLLQLPPATECICKFYDVWLVYDTIKKKSRMLEAAEVSTFELLFPTLVQDSRILCALQVSSINPNRLLQLTATPKAATSTSNA